MAVSDEFELYSINGNHSFRKSDICIGERYSVPAFMGEILVPHKSWCTVEQLILICEESIPILFPT